MVDLCGKDHVDRLPIIVTSSGVCQLLKVSKMTGGAGNGSSSYTGRMKSPRACGWNVFRYNQFKHIDTGARAETEKKNNNTWTIY